MDHYLKQKKTNPSVMHGQNGRTGRVARPDAVQASSGALARVKHLINTDKRKAFRCPCVEPAIQSKISHAS
jgi:hypothetical protein